MCEIVHFVKSNLKVNLCSDESIKWKQNWMETDRLLNHTVGRAKTEIGPCGGWQARTPRWTQTGTGGKTEVRDDDKRVKAANFEIKDC